MEKKDYLIERLEKEEFNKEPRTKDKFDLVSLDDEDIKFLGDSWRVE
jgi:hypothetical protein